MDRRTRDRYPARSVRAVSHLGDTSQQCDGQLPGDADLFRRHGREMGPAAAGRRRRTGSPGPDAYAVVRSTGRAARRQYAGGHRSLGRGRRRGRRRRRRGPGCAELASAVVRAAAAVVRAAAAALLAAMVAIVALAGAPAASAHATRIAVDPAENASLTTGPTRVSATFNEPLQTTFAAMTVVGPDGNLWSTGDPRIQGAVVSVKVRPLGPSGSYTVNYRVTSADGHVVSGSWSFRLTVAGTGTPGPAPAATGAGGGIPTWPFVALALVLVVGAAVW